MLPYFVEQDFADVLAEQNASGFRCAPIGSHLISNSASPIGDFATLGVEIELRQALEPWHVMGEKAQPAAPSATSTPPSSGCKSRTTGLAPERFAITVTASACRCARRDRGGVRRRRPLPRMAGAIRAAPDDPGTHAADVRPDRHLDGAFNGWLQVSCDPPGRSHYDVFPVNAFEAEKRRLARFFRMGHTPGER